MPGEFAQTDVNPHRTFGILDHSTRKSAGGWQGQARALVWREPPIAFFRVHGGKPAKIGGVFVSLCKRHLSSDTMLLIYEGILTPTRTGLPNDFCGSGLQYIFYNQNNVLMLLIR